MDLPNRKHIRLQGYDYSQNGAYYLTICVQNRECLFGDIVDGEMILSMYGDIVLKHIQILCGLYDEITVDKYIVMPNHIHLIIKICRECIVCIPNKQNNNKGIKDKTKMTIPKIIQAFKSSVTKEIRMADDRHACNACPTKIWQSRYYDHIIRNEEEYIKIWKYIDTNPLKWDVDSYNNNM